MSTKSANPVGAETGASYKASGAHKTIKAGDLLADPFREKGSLRAFHEAVRALERRKVKNRPSWSK